MKHMNIKEFANLLDNREYKYPQQSKQLTTSLFQNVKV